MNSMMVIIAVIAIGGGTAGAVILGLQGSDEALCRELLAKSAKLDFVAMAQMEDKNCERFISTEEMMEATIGGSVDLYNNIVSPDRQVEEPETKPTHVEPVRSELTGEIIKPELIEKYDPQPPWSEKYPTDYHGRDYYNMKEVLDYNEGIQKVILKACENRNQDHVALLPCFEECETEYLDKSEYLEYYGERYETFRNLLYLISLKEQNEMQTRLIDHEDKHELIHECVDEYKELEILLQYLP